MISELLADYEDVDWFYWYEIDTTEEKKIDGMQNTTKSSEHTVSSIM